MSGFQFQNPAPGQDIDTFCEDYIKLRPWDQPGYVPKDDICNQYDYNPSKAMGAAFLTLFSILTAVHFVQTITAPWIPRIGGRGYGNTPIRWGMLAVTGGGLLEILGWAGRVWNSNLPDENTPFIISTTTLIIGPSFFSAAIYTAFGWVILAIEQPTAGVEAPPKSHSLLKATRYVGIFVIGDIISLVLQAIGGGIAATAASDDQDQADMGTNIMEAGIVFQLVVTIIFAFVSLFFFRSVSRTWKGGEASSEAIKVHTMDSTAPMLSSEGKTIVPLPKAWSDPVWFAVIGIALETSMIIFRGVYRTVELAQGWSGYLITHEPFLLLDSIPMVFCMLFFVLCHPHWTLPRHAGLGPKPAKKSKKSKKGAPMDMEKGHSAMDGSTATLTPPGKDGRPQSSGNDTLTG